MLQRSSSKALYLVAQMQKHTVISTISRLSSELANPLLLSRWSRGSGSGLFEKTRSTTLAWLHVRYREIIASQFVRNGRAFRKRKCRKPEAVRTDDDLAREMLNNQTRICEFFHFSDISIRSIFVNRWISSDRVKANLNFSFRFVTFEHFYYSFVRCYTVFV